MTQCRDCKYCVVPKVSTTTLDAVCINIKVNTGAVKMQWKCKYGEKR